jgi:hypothetical protein
MDRSRLSLEIPNSPDTVPAKELIAATMHPGDRHHGSADVEMGQKLGNVPHGHVSLAIGERLEGEPASDRKVFPLREDLKLQELFRKVLRSYANVRCMGQSNGGRLRGRIGCGRRAARAHESRCAQRRNAHQEVAATGPKSFAWMHVLPPRCPGDHLAPLERRLCNSWRNAVIASPMTCVAFGSALQQTM